MSRSARGGSCKRWRLPSGRCHATPACHVRAGVRARGFTLLEILLSLALIGLLSAALISAGSHLVEARPRTPAEIFWEASRSARRLALKSQQEVRLNFDEKEKHFVISGAGKQETFPVNGSRNLMIDLLPARSTGGALLIGGNLVESDPLDFVTFFRDGTCTPFRVQIRSNGPAQVIAIDPWTTAEVLTDESKT